MCLRLWFDSGPLQGMQKREVSAESYVSGIIVSGFESEFIRGLDHV